MSALGRTRTCELLIRRHSPLETENDTERHRGPKPRFCRGFTFSKGQGGTGRDTQLRSDCGQNLGAILGCYQPRSRIVAGCSEVRAVHTE